MSGRGAAAVKCFVADLVGGGRGSESTPSPLQLISSSDSDANRVWVQGVAVASGLGGRGDVRGFVMDDGTGLLSIDARKLPPLAPSSSPSPSSSSLTPASMPCPLGSYVMVIGSVGRSDDGARTVVAAKLVDLSSDPNRESMWLLEVIESSLRAPT